LYFTAEASYRAVAKTLHISRNVIFNELNRLGENCKSFEQIAHELRPQWSGYLLIDGKTIPIKRNKESLLLTADTKTQDIPCAGLYGSEEATNYKELLECVKNEIHYPIKGITVDGDPALLSAISSVFQEVPLQLCVLHYTENLKRHFKYHFRGITYGVPRFIETVHKILCHKHCSSGSFISRVS
jgi:transposase-like protein